MGRRHETQAEDAASVGALMGGGERGEVVGGVGGDTLLPR